MEKHLPPDRRDETLHQAVFDALPSAAFILDEKLIIRDLNDAAVKLPEEVLNNTVRPDWREKNIGEWLRCLPAGGCGSSDLCRSCGIQQGARHAGQGVTMRGNVHVQTSTAGVNYMITAAPFANHGERLVLILLEDAARWPARTAASAGA